MMASTTATQRKIGCSTVYGVILNDRASLDQLGDAVNSAPYKTPPRAPILYLKPANTHLLSGASVYLPAGGISVDIGATLGVVIGKPSGRLTMDDAMQAVKGYLLAADLSLPQTSYYRPAIREKCFNGACPLGSMIPVHALPAIEQVVIDIRVDGKAIAQRHFREQIRDISRLLVDVTEFMTLNRDDVLLIGVNADAPSVMVGHAVELSAPTLGTLAFSVKAHKEREPQ